jgi:hypothetical protein
MATIKRSQAELFVQDALEQVFEKNSLAAFDDDDATFLRNLISGYLRMTAYRGKSPFAQVERLRRVVVAFLPDRSYSKRSGASGASVAECASASERSERAFDIPCPPRSRL